MFSLSATGGADQFTLYSFDTSGGPRIGTDGAGNVEGSATSTFEWHHVLAVSQTWSDREMFQNGVSEGSSSFASVVMESTAELTLGGGHKYSIEGTGGGGLLYDMAVWDRPLLVEHALALYRGTPPTELADMMPVCYLPDGQFDVLLNSPWVLNAHDGTWKQDGLPEARFGGQGANRVFVPVSYERPYGGLIPSAHIEPANTLCTKFAADETNFDYFYWDDAEIGDWMQNETSTTKLVMSGWFYLDTWPSQDIYPFGLEYIGGSAKKFSVRFDLSSDDVALLIHSGINGDESFVADAAVTGSWHHIFAMYDREPTSSVKAMVNGVAGTDDGNEDIWHSSFGPDAVYIGTGENFVGNNAYGGMCKDVAFWFLRDGGGIATDEVDGIGLELFRGHLRPRDWLSEELLFYWSGERPDFAAEVIIGRPGVYLPTIGVEGTGGAATLVGGFDRGLHSTVSQRLVATIRDEPFARESGRISGPIISADPDPARYR